MSGNRAHNYMNIESGQKKWIVETEGNPHGFQNLVVFGG